MVGVRDPDSEKRDQPSAAEEISGLCFPASMFEVPLHGSVCRLCRKMNVVSTAMDTDGLIIKQRETKTVRKPQAVFRA